MERRGVIGHWEGWRESFLLSSDDFGFVQIWYGRRIHRLEHTDYTEEYTSCLRVEYLQKRYARTKRYKGKRKSKEKRKAKRERRKRS
jgi:hypothetical protein